MTMVSLIKRVLLFSIAFVAVVAALVYFTLFTSTGIQKAVWVAKMFMPDRIHIGAVSGDLSSSLFLKQFQYRDHDHMIALDQLVLSIDPWPLLRRQPVLIRLNLHHMTVRLAKSSQSYEKQSTKLLPNWVRYFKYLRFVAIELTDLTVNREKKQVLDVRQLQLHTGEDDVAHFELQSSLGNYSGEGVWYVQPSLSWSLNLQGKSIPVRLPEYNIDGLMNIQFAAQGEWGRLKKDIQLNVSTLSGVVNHQPIEAVLSIGFHQGNWTIDRAKFAWGKALFNAQGSWGHKNDLRVQLAIPSLTQVLPKASGSVLVDFYIRGSVPLPAVSLSLELSQIKIGQLRLPHAKMVVAHQDQAKKWFVQNGAVNGLEISTYLLPDFTFTAYADHSAKGIESELNINFDVNNNIQSKWHLPAWSKIFDKNKAQKFNAELVLDLAHVAGLQHLASLIPHTEIRSGKIHGQVMLNGQLGVLEWPKMDGRISLHDASLRLTPVNVVLSDVRAQANYRSGQPLTFDGKFKIDSEQGTVDGFIDLEQANLPMRIKLSGQNWWMIKNSEYEVKASPDLILDWTKQSPMLSGDIMIPYADIHPIELEQTIALSPDVIIVDKAQTEAQSFLAQLGLSLRIKLGQKVNVHYQNLKTKLLGSLTLEQVPGGMLRASGELNAVAGTYRAYGGVLTIKQGRLLYAGNRLFNPGLDIRAVTKVQRVDTEGQSQFDGQVFTPVFTGVSSTLVGVWVHGTIDRPITTLYSDPPGMSQGDILSYLLFGYPQSQLGGASSLFLLKMASDVYGGNQQLDFLQQFQDILGFDDFSIGKTEFFNPQSSAVETATSFNIGRKLGKKLSLHYSVGLFQELSVFTLRYQINRRLAAQSETSPLEVSTDLLYQIESRD